MLPELDLAQIRAAVERELRDLHEAVVDRHDPDLAPPKAPLPDLLEPFRELRVPYVAAALEGRGTDLLQRRRELDVADRAVLEDPGSVSTFPNSAEHLEPLVQDDPLQRRTICKCALGNSPERRWCCEFFQTRTIESANPDLLKPTVFAKHH